MRGVVVGIAAALVIALAAASPAAALEMWAVGDGGDSGANDDQVGAYIHSRAPDQFVYLGDVYPSQNDTEGSYQLFQDYYHPAFGQWFQPFTRPTPGNHEWPNHAAGYDPYFGSRAPQTGGGHWYSFDAGGWHFVSLNSEEAIGEGSAQLDWLRSDLASQPGDCTLAYTHKPRFTDGFFAGAYESALKRAWDALSGRAQALISAHDHNYQRFNPVGGVTQLVVGTGGHSLHAVKPSARLAAWVDDTYGALHLTLAPGRADYEFVSADGARRDGGTFTCTNPPAPGPGPAPDPGPQPPPPAPPAGGGPAAPAHDDDPLVLIGRPRGGSAQSRRLRLLSGTSANVKGPIRLVLTRRGKGRCRALGPKGLRYSCRKAPAWRAKGLRPWRLRLPRRAALTPGSYRLVAYAGPVSDRVDFRIR